MTAMVLLSDWMASQVEFWQKTKYEGYDVSSFGRVRSHWLKGSKRQRGEPRILKGSKDSYGYWFIEFGHRGGKRRRSWVHRLVTETFIPNTDSLPEINHKNAIKSDNRLGNLEWISSQGNVRHATDSGLRERARFPGELSFRTSLTEKDVREIRERAARGEHYKEIAKDYTVGAGGVKHIVNRRTWRHLD